MSGTGMYFWRAACSLPTWHSTRGPEEGAERVAERMRNRHPPLSCPRSAPLLYSTKPAHCGAPAAVVAPALHASSVIPLWLGAAFALASGVLVISVPSINTEPERSAEAQPTDADGMTLSAG